MRLPEDMVQYIDRPEVSETFSDSLGLCNFQNQTAMVEFCVTRFDKVNPPDAPTGRRYPVTRLLMTPELIVDLFQFMQNMMSIMQREGIIKLEQKPKLAKH